MTPESFRQIRDGAGLSAAGLASLLRLGEQGGRTVRRWEAAERPIPGPVAFLMELLGAGKLKRHLAGRAAK